MARVSRLVPATWASVGHSARAARGGHQLGLPMQRSSSTIQLTDGPLSRARRATERHDALNWIEVIGCGQVLEIGLRKPERPESVDDRDAHRPGDTGWLAQERGQALELTGGALVGERRDRRRPDPFSPSQLGQALRRVASQAARGRHR